MTDTEAAVLERRVPSLQLSGEDMGPRAHMGGARISQGAAGARGRWGFPGGKSRRARRI